LRHEAAARLYLETSVMSPALTSRGPSLRPRAWGRRTHVGRTIHRAVHRIEAEHALDLAPRAVLGRGPGRPAGWRAVGDAAPSSRRRPRGGRGAQRDTGSGRGSKRTPGPHPPLRPRARNNLGASAAPILATRVDGLRTRVAASTRPRKAAFDPRTTRRPFGTRQGSTPRPPAAECAPSRRPGTWPRRKRRTAHSSR
jgi:hypothetical protein